MITNGLEDGKIASLFYFEGILYILHDNDRVIRSWEVSTGAFVSEFTLPLVSEGEAFAQQWEGFAIERNTAGNFAGSGGSDTAMRLRGSTAQQRQEQPPPSSFLTVHLVLDSPPQIWSFAVEEGEGKGQLIFPECSGIRSS